MKAELNDGTIITLDDNAEWLHNDELSRSKNREILEKMKVSEPPHYYFLEHVYVQLEIQRLREKQRMMLALNIVKLIKEK